MNDRFITNSEEDTIKLGEEFASRLKPKDVILLFGELGSGKTTFSKGIAKGLAVPNRLTSPTFIVLRTYTAKNKKIKKIYHLDLYRLQNEKEIKNIALFDLLADDEAITIIEWPELLSEIKIQNKYEIDFSAGSNDTRMINIKNE